MRIHLQCFGQQALRVAGLAGRHQPPGFDHGSLRGHRLVGLRRRNRIARLRQERREGILHVLGGLIAILARLGHRAGDDALDLGERVAPGDVHRRRRLGHHPEHDRRQAGVLVFEGPAARAHFVGHRAGGIDVGAAVDGLALQLLRRRVVRRPHDRAGGGQRFGLRHARQAEVHELDRAVRQPANVARLDVAVDHALAVRVFERVQDLHQRPNPLFERERAPMQHLPEVFTFQVLHHHVHGAVDFTRFVHRHDVRVREARACLGFAQQAAQVVGAGDVGPDGLDGDHATQRRIDGLVDLTHAAGAEQRLHDESSDALGKRGGSRRHLKTSRKRPGELCPHRMRCG